MTPLRVLIVDDEPVARRRLRRLLAAEPGVVAVGDAADGEAAIDAVRRLRPDVVLLDIQMPEVSGLDVVLRIDAPRPHIIFVTAHDAHAVRAFELHALDYLLKPVTPARLASALARARTPQARTDAAAAVDPWTEWMRPAGPIARLPVPDAGRIELVPVARIDWIEAADNYVILHCGATTHILRETLTRLEQRLDARQFVRVHRSTIVQRDRIVRLEPLSRGDWRLTLSDGTAITMSRTYRGRVMTGGVSSRQNQHGGGRDT